MNIGVITQTNSKGQIVIPKKYRKKLGIDENVPLNIVLGDNSICVYPVKEVLTQTERRVGYLEILKKTQGTWTGEDKKKEQARRRVELAKVKKLKEKW